MSCGDKSMSLELMALKKPTALDELIETIPKPRGAIPNFGLPRWKVMPLESKIPMIPGPEGSYDFTRNKIGKKLWIGSTDAEFNLNDPYNYEAEWTYEPLHDEHLAKFFKRPVNFRRMLNLGLVTKKLDAKCSVRDYNIYRKYLKTLYNDSINHEIKRRTMMDFENRALCVAEKLAEKDVERLKARERRMEASSQLLEKIRQEEAQKLQRRKDRQLKMEQQLGEIESNKIKANKLRIQKALEQAFILRRKQETAAFIERQKIVKTVQQWKDSEYKRKSAKAKRHLEEREKRLTAVEEKWQIRQEMQKKQMEREKFLQQCSNEERLMNIQSYNAKVNKERARMQKMAEEYKMFIRCYTRRHVAGQRVGTCCFKRRRENKLDKNDAGNSCNRFSKSHPTDKNSKKVNKKEKKKSTAKNQKKKKRSKKKIIPEPEPEIEEPQPEPMVSRVESKFIPRAQEPLIIKDNCKCEQIKTLWLEKRKINNTEDV